MSNPKTRYSKQRETIYEVLVNDCTHPNVDTIYMNVKKIIPDISLGTVYRNLNVLAEQKRIRRLDIGEGAVRFDAKLEPHYHLICNECHDIQDLEIDESLFSPLIDNVQNHCHVLIDRADIIFHGTCNKCLKRKS